MHVSETTAPPTPSHVDVTAADWLARAQAALSSDGVVLLRNTGLEPYARSVGEQMHAELERLLRIEDDVTVYAGGHLRQYPPVGEGAHAPELIGAAPVLALCRAVLGQLYVASYQGHTILPGAQAQPVHVDWDPLWLDFDQPVPPFMLAANIALTPTGEENGSIEFWPGTHRIPPRDLFQANTLRIRPEHLERRRETAPPGRIDMEPGDVLIRDVLTWHRGMPNRSGSARPILWLLLAKSWFRAEHDDDLVLPVASRPAIEALGVPVACRFADGPVERSHLPKPVVSQGFEES